MLEAEEIIRRKANPEGFPISQEALASFLIKELPKKSLLQYGNVLFTIDKSTFICHMYSLGTGVELLRAMRKFTKDVWGVVNTNYVDAPVLNEQIKRILERLGFYEFKVDSLTGYKILRLERV